MQLLRLRKYGLHFYKVSKMIDFLWSLKNNGIKPSIVLLRYSKEFLINLYKHMHQFLLIQRCNHNSNIFCIFQSIFHNFLLAHTKLNYEITLKRSEMESKSMKNALRNEPPATLPQFLLMNRVQGWQQCDL